MDPMAPPPTMPAMPQKKRRPFDLSVLPAAWQQQLAGGMPISLEDGSVLYPDGTAEGAGDSPDDFTGGPAYDYGAGGWGMAPQLGGSPDGVLPAPDAGMDLAPADPFASPIFDRYVATANAPFPGQPGGIGGGPLDDSMGLGAPASDVLPPPFGQQPAMGPSLTVESPRVSYGQADTARPGGGFGSIPGRMGRRLGQSPMPSQGLRQRRRGR